MSNVAKIPTLDDLIVLDENSIAQNQLMVLLNQPPPENWLKIHPFVRSTAVNEKGQTIQVPYRYLPIERIEYLLSRIYGKWWVEVLDHKILANAVTVSIRLFVKNPLTNEIDHNDGLGASPIQTDKGQGAMDWNFAKSDGVVKALPSAESYAIKDAAEKFGKLFGKDLARKEEINYNSILKKSNEDVLIELKELFDFYAEFLQPDEAMNIERIIKEEEKQSYKKAVKILTIIKSKNE